MSKNWFGHSHSQIQIYGLLLENIYLSISFIWAAVEFQPTQQGKATNRYKLNMKRPAAYVDATADQNPASQIQRMHHNDRISNFPGRPDLLSASERGHSYISSRTEGQWQWDRDAPNSVSSQPYLQGQRGNVAQSLLQAEYRKVDLEKQAVQSHELDMEIGYEDKPSQLTYEALEHKLQEELMKLVKEQNDAEDKENARHREKIIEINAQCEEKLSSLRARHAKQREEYLLKESEERLHQYQQTGMAHQLIKSGASDPRVYGGTPAAAAAEAHRSHASVKYDSYRERSPFLGGGIGQGAEARVPYPEGHLEARVPYPEGCVYNNAGARYY